MKYSNLPVSGDFKVTCEYGREGNWKARLSYRN